MKYMLCVITLLCGLPLYTADHVKTHAASMYPMPPKVNTGLASWYGEQHQGKLMANGRRFDRRALTTASRTLPLGSWIRVFNLRNGKSVEVQVTDRGPNKRLRNRILDLSEAAAKRLGFRQKGLTKVAFVSLAESHNGMPPA
jgi:rare lipoprotein A